MDELRGCGREREKPRVTITIRMWKHVSEETADQDEDEILTASR